MDHKASAKYGISLKWLAVSCFEIRCGNLSIVTDPYITPCKGTDLTWKEVEQCDMILLSHTHTDHIADIPALTEQFRPLILCSDQSALPMAQWLNYTPTRVYPMYPDLELDFGDVKVRSLHGNHKARTEGYNDLMARRSPASPYEVAKTGSLVYRNYLLTLPNGTKLLFWGGDPNEEECNLLRELQPDIAIIQRSVKPDNIVQRAKFAADIGAKIVIPHHQDVYRADDPEILHMFTREFLSHAPDRTVILPEHGAWLHL